MKKSSFASHIFIWKLNFWNRKLILILRFLNIVMSLVIHNRVFYFQMWRYLNSPDTELNTLIFQHFVKKCNFNQRKVIKKKIVSHSTMKSSLYEKANISFSIMVIIVINKTWIYQVSRRRHRWSCFVSGE